MDNNAVPSHPYTYLLETDPLNSLPLINFLSYPLPGNEYPSTVDLITIIDVILQLSGYSTPWRDHVFTAEDHSLRTLRKINHWLTIPAFRAGNVVYSLTVLYWHVCETSSTIPPHNTVTDDLLQEILISGEMLWEATKMFTPSVFPRDVMWAQLRLCTAIRRIAEGYKNGTFPITTVPEWTVLLNGGTSSTVPPTVPTVVPSTLRTRLETDYLYSFALRTGIQNLAIYIGSGAAGVNFPGISITEEARALLIVLRERNPPVSAYLVATECIRYLHTNGSTARGTTALLMIIRDSLMYTETANLLNRSKGILPLLDIMENLREPAWSLISSFHIDTPDIPLPSTDFSYYRLPALCEHFCATMLNLCVRPKVSDNITLHDIKRILRIAVSSLTFYFTNIHVCEIGIRLIIHPCLIHHQYSIMGTELAIQMGILPIFTRILKQYTVRHGKHQNIHIYIAEALEIMSNSPSLCGGLTGSIRTLLETWIENLQGKYDSNNVGNNGNTNSGSTNSTSLSELSTVVLPLGSSSSSSSDTVTTNTTTGNSTSVASSSSTGTTDSVVISELVYTKLGKVASKLITYADTPEYTAVNTDLHPDLQIPMTDPPGNWRETVLLFGSALEDAYFPS